MTADRIQVNCPECTATLAVPIHAAGKKIRCPKCLGIADIPEPMEELPEAQAPSARLRPRRMVALAQWPRPTHVRVPVLSAVKTESFESHPLSQAGSVLTQRGTAVPALMDNPACPEVVSPAADAFISGVDPGTGTLPNAATSPSTEIVAEFHFPPADDVNPLLVEPAFVEPAFVEPAFVEPAFVEPAFVEPAFVESKLVERPIFVSANSGADPLLDFALLDQTYSDDLKSSIMAVHPVRRQRIPSRSESQTRSTISSISGTQQKKSTPTGRLQRIVRNSKTLAGAVAWFTVGYGMMGILFANQPILFIGGLVAISKDLLGIR